MMPAPKIIQLLIIDDQLVVREGLRMLIENQPGMKVAAMTSTCQEALELVANDSFDLIILNLELGGQSALPFVAQLREATKASRILVLTGLRDSETHQKAVQLGAMGVVLKEDAADRLIKAIEKVYLGEVWLDRMALGNLLWQLSSHDKEALDPQMKKIATLT